LQTESESGAAVMWKTKIYFRHRKSGRILRMVVAHHVLCYTIEDSLPRDFEILIPRW